MTTELLAERLQDQTNPIVSPYCLSTAFYLLELAASDSVRADLSELVELPDKSTVQKHKRALQTAGVRAVESAWSPAGGFNDEYVELIDDWLGAPVEGQATAKKINEWVKDKTDGCIEEIINENALGRGETAVLLSALYFDEDWSQPFDEENTQPETFHDLTGQFVSTVQLMRQTGHFGYAENEQLKVVELPCENDCRARFYVPKLQSPMQDVQQLLGAYQDQALDLSEQEVEVELPRFTFEQEHDLRSFFEAHDFDYLYNPGRHFETMMAGNTQISEAKQAVFFDLDEDGTEAAAATSMAVARAAAVPSETIRADRPFVVELSHPDVPIPLFIGLIQDPSDGQDKTEKTTASSESAEDDESDESAERYMGIDALKEALSSLTYALYHGTGADEDALRATVGDRSKLPDWADTQLQNLRDNSIFASSFEADQDFDDLYEKAVEKTLNPEPPSASSDIVDVILTNPGPNRVAIMEAIRSVTNNDIDEVKALIDDTPATVKEGVHIDDGQQIACELQKAGAQVSFGDDKGRPVLIG